MNRTELCVYLVLTGAMLVLLVVSAREPVERGRCSRLVLPFRKAAAKLLRSRRICRLFPFLLWEEERAQRELSLLDPASGKREAGEHCIERLQNVLLTLFLADVLALSVSAEAAQKTVLFGREIARPDYGERTREVTLKAEPDGGTFDLQVHARKYTKEQADAMEEELAPKLRALILGDNPDLFHVRKNLNLVRKAEGYPFRISWSATSYTYLDTDGTVHAEEIPRDESSSLVLTAALSLDGNRWEEKFPVVLLPEELTAEEAFQRSVQEAAKEAEEESAEETAMVLPDTVEGTALSWQQVLEDESLKVFLIIQRHHACMPNVAWGEGVRMLFNDHRDVRRGSAVLEVGGIPDPAAGRMGGELPEPSEVFAGGVNGAFRLMLSHEPAFFIAEGNDADLQLSGHTHGGMMPILRQVVAGANAGFVRGLYSRGSRYLYVSDGTGIWNGFSCRILTPPEITVLTLRKAG